jgi:GNAT superfamily N-acetyltransferase
MAGLLVIDVTDQDSFRRIPPCADPRFDHRTCDYWEDADRGSKAARPAWLTEVPVPARATEPEDDNPFRPRRDTTDPLTAAAIASMLDPLAGDDLFATPGWNPFAPGTRPTGGTVAGPRKLRLLDRGRAVFGSYAKVLLADDVAVAYAQFGPLSAYPRASRLRELYPHLPRSPLPAVITCVATTREARRHGHARHLVEAICTDLSERGFAAVEAYPDEGLPEDEGSAGRTGFWLAFGFSLAAHDERYPVMRRALGP